MSDACILCGHDFTAIPGYSPGRVYTLRGEICHRCADVSDKLIPATLCSHHRVNSPRANIYCACNDTNPATNGASAKCFKDCSNYWSNEPMDESVLRGLIEKRGVDWVLAKANAEAQFGKEE